MGQNTITATDQNFTDLITGETPVLVDFWAEWCGPCKMMNAPLEDLAGTQSDQLSVAKLNVDENQQTAMNYDVMSIPTMIIFQGRRREEAPRGCPLESRAAASSQELAGVHLA